jgi:uncharacterized protein RhaS with RHS repeats
MALTVPRSATSGGLLLRRGPSKDIVGQYADDETGPHYNHHRYYDPVTGAYLSPDPLG